MSPTLLQVVEHYQKKVERYNDEEKILHCFGKLGKLPITVQILSQTGVGKTVNAFRRDPGPVGTKSRELVSKWKQIFKENERLENEQSKGESSSEDDDRHRRKQGSELVKKEKNRTPSPAGSEGSDRLEIDEVNVKQEPEADYVNQTRRSSPERHSKEKHKRRPDEESEKRRTKSKHVNGVKIKQEAELSADNSAVEDDREERDGHDRIRVKQEQEVEREKERKRAERESVDVSSKHKLKSKEHTTSGDEIKNSHKVSSKEKHARHEDGEHASKEGSSSSKHRKESRRREHKHKEKENKSSTFDETISLATVKTEPLTNGESNKDKMHRDKHKEKHKKSSKHREKSEKQSSSKSSSSKHAAAEPELSDSEQSSQLQSSGTVDSTSYPSAPSKHKHSSSKHDSSKHAQAASRQQPKSKHKSSKKEKRRSEESSRREAKSRPTLKEVDFLAVPGGSGAASDDDAPAASSFADALGRLETPKKKRKAASKTSGSSGSISTSSKPRPVFDTADASPPPPPPPPVELLDVLPEIPAYRPLPRPPLQNTKTAAKRLLDEEEALASVLHNKNKRSKIYSGSKGVGLSRVPTLIEIAIRCLQDNIDYLEFTGGVPYDILRPVLERCSAVQLHNIEYYNPYLLEDTDPLWEALVRKEFKAEKRREMETWRDMHTRCAEERQQKYNKLCSLIEGKRKESLATSRKTKVAFEHTVAKPPRNVARKQAQNGTALPVSMPMPGSQQSSGGVAGVRGASRPPPGLDPTSRAAAPARAAAPVKKKAPLMAKVLRAMGRR